ncbi:hypothetical protein CRYUN_Cryun19dG0055500 [Craigia yunnanensis]
MLHHFFKGRWHACDCYRDEGILVIPTTAYPPPKLGSKQIFSEDYWNCMFSLLRIVSISGCCQVKFSLMLVYVKAYCLSFIARHGGDRLLLDTVQTMYLSLQEHADTVSKSKLSCSAVNQEHSAEVAKEKVSVIFLAFKLAKFAYS